MITRVNNLARNRVVNTLKSGIEPMKPQASKCITYITSIQPWLRIEKQTRYENLHQKAARYLNEKFLL